MTIERALEALQKGHHNYTTFLTCVSPRPTPRDVEKLKREVEFLDRWINDAIEELTKPCETCGGKPYVLPDTGSNVWTCPNNCVDGRVPIRRERMSDVTPINDPDVLNDAIAQQNERIAELERERDAAEAEAKKWAGIGGGEARRTMAAVARCAVLLEALKEIVRHIHEEPVSEDYICDTARPLIADPTAAEREMSEALAKVKVGWESEMAAKVRAWDRYRNKPRDAYLDHVADEMDAILKEEQVREV